MANRRINDGFKHIMEREALEALLTRCYTKPGVVSGVVSTNITFTPTTYSTAKGLEYCIAGYFYSITPIASGKYLPQGAGFSICASGQARMWAVCLDSVGSVHLYGGPAVSAGVAAQLQSVPLTLVCPVGLVKVSCASNFSFTLGTMAWGSASLVSCTVEYWDISVLPQGVILSD
jgi:hypothetical protein